MLRFDHRVKSAFGEQVRKEGRQSTRVRSLTEDAVATAILELLTEHRASLVRQVVLGEHERQRRRPRLAKDGANRAAVKQDIEHQAPSSVK
jgi:hypothetical protein